MVQENAKEATEDNQPESKSSWLFMILRLNIVFIILCGILYPLVSTGLAQVLMPSKAGGSQIKDEAGTVIGSKLIGQNFTSPGTFHGRVSSIEYKAEASGSNNYGPSNEDMLQRTRDFIAQWKMDNPDADVSKLPVDLVTNSGSGLDPDITPQSAKVQIRRISKATGISEGQLEELVDKHTKGRDLGVFGEKRVNVLELNLALQELK